MAAEELDHLTGDGTQLLVAAFTPYKIRVDVENIGSAEQIDNFLPETRYAKIGWFALYENAAAAFGTAMQAGHYVIGPFWIQFYRQDFYSPNYPNGFESASGGVDGILWRLYPGVSVNIQLIY
jgi:hypothetical protein